MAKAQTKAKPAPVEEAAAEIEVGSYVTFLGYPADTPEAERILVEGEAYPVVQLPQVETIDGEEVETQFILQIPNPDFNSKKKVNPETNPEFLETEVFPEEIALAVDGEEQEEQEEETPPEPAAGEGEEEPLTYEELAGYDADQLIEFAKVNEVKLTAAQKKDPAKMLAFLAETFQVEPAEEEEPEPETPPAKPETAAAKKKREATEAAAEKAAATAAAAKPAGKGAAKGAAAAKPAAAKPAGKAPEQEAEDPDEVPELEGEDENVLALVEGADDLVAVAQELESTASITEYQLGGVLYHIKKEKAHLATDKKGKLLNPEYGEPGGWKLFLQQNFNLDYRKAVYLIDIYINFTLAGLENPSEIIGRIGWTKASKIAKLVGTEGTDLEVLLETAATNTVEGLSKIIKDEYNVGGQGEKPTPVLRTTLSFRYVQEEAQVVESILTETAERLGIKPDEALYQILTEYHARELAGAVEEEPVATTAKTAAKPAARQTARARA